VLRSVAGKAGGTVIANEARLWRQDYEQLKRVLMQAQDERPKRADLVLISNGSSGDTEPVMGWVIHEWETMLTEVNRIRALRDKNPISMYDVRRVEQSAAGHIDYTQKYAIGCADLVHL
jgi:hypothetical protein